MTVSHLNTIFKIEVDASTLLREYPADRYHKYKQKLYQLTAIETKLSSGQVLISKYNGTELPLYDKHQKMDIQLVNAMFKYLSPKEGFKSWYVNFADEILFNYYGSPLMAQDELQVAEHPLLANVTEMIHEYSKKDSKYSPYTKDYDAIPYTMPTPILIEGIERRIEIDVLPNKNNPNGIYGNNFSKADWNDIKEAVSIFEEPTKSNIVAMEAYPGATGEYTLKQITDIFRTAYISFCAVKNQSDNSNVELHTGDWGTGAYGGNKILTACLQLLAATAAKIDLLVFHTFDKASFKKTQLLYDEIYKNAFDKNLQRVVNKLFDMKFRWEVGDGN